MTQDQFQNLLEKAKPLLGQKLPVRVKGNPDIVDYTFTAISNTFGIAEEGQQKNYSILGKLVSDSGDVLTEPLSKIVSYLESKAI